MATNRQQLKQLFNAAVELAPPEREAFLKVNCANDDELVSEVSAPLTAHDSAGNFIQQPALIDVGLVTIDEHERSPAITGQQIGTYISHQRIGTRRHGRRLSRSPRR